MNKKIKIISLCLLSSVFLISCGKDKTKTSSNSSSSFEEPPYTAKEVIEDDYVSSCIKGTGNIFVNGNEFLKTSSYLKDPTTFTTSLFQNVIRKCPINSESNKNNVIVYTPDWWLRKTSEREGTVFEYVIRKNDNDEYVVTEVKNSTGTIVPLDGLVISIPQGAAVDSLSQGQVITFDSSFTLHTYQTAIYTDEDRRIPIAEINPHYIGLNAAALYDVASDTKLVRSDNIRLNTVSLHYDATTKSYLVDDINQKTYNNDLNVPLDGILLANQSTTSNNQAVKLEENVMIKQNSKVYFERPTGLFNDTITYKIGYQGREEVDGEQVNIGPNVEILTDSKVNNEWGYEIAVVNGKVVDSAVNLEQPTNGYRIRFSSFNDAIENHIATLRDQFKVGVPVSYNSNTVTVSYNLVNFASEYLTSLKNQINSYITEQETKLYDYDVNKVKEIKTKFEENETAIAQIDVSSDTTSQNYYVSKINYAKYLAEQAFLYSSNNQEPVETRSAWHYPLSNPETLDTINKVVKQLKDANFNEVIVSGSIDETNNFGTAYTSKYSKTAPSLSGKFGKYKDYLDAFVHIAHDAGLKVQVCMANWFFYKAIVEKYPDFNNCFATNFDGSVGTDSDGEITKFLDPANETVRTLYLNMYKEIVDNYDIDGFHLDYIRYGANNDWVAPNSQGYTEAAMNGFEAAYPQYSFTSLADFKNKLQNNATMYKDFSDYRRSVVTNFVGDVREVAAGKQLTIAVVSDADTAKSTKLQDWKTWLTNNYIDSIHLMAYYCDKGYVIKDSLAALEHANGHSYVVTGVSTIYSNLEMMELPTQFDGARSTGVHGTALFATHSFGNRPELGEYLNGANGRGVYNKKAIACYESLKNVNNAFVTTIKDRVEKYYKSSSYMTSSQGAALKNDLDALNKLTNFNQASTKLNEIIASANSGSYGTDAVKDRLLETLNYMKSIYVVKAYKMN